MTTSGHPDDAASNTEPAWYEGGLQFECTQCGNCCTGPPGRVWFSEEEGEAMAEALGVEVDHFYDQFARRFGRRWSLREGKTKHGYDCIFLNREDGRALCKVYKARPTQCRTWPFWAENLESPAAWEETKHDTPCPGMGQGTLVPVEEIRIRRDATPD